MLELKGIYKVYKLDNIKQVALNDINISFRKSEFVSILGPSGSGKTTLLNIIGGLDKYDSGDLIINGTSTRNYKDRDFDSYRNHRIGFVFQSYNLISHQNVLSNVELALTLSGVKKKTRTRIAKQALYAVGLKDHMYKKPNQLSGGQMQRVAIARALVNNPDIILADEPTGALDSTTSKQIMDILKEIAKDRLVIMVTHNPELAVAYSNRIIKIKDGKIIGDTNPYRNDNTVENKNSKRRKSKMSLSTALSLSLNNLMTKKGRTILTAFAGSIGIIGIALILALSTGVNKYINDEQRDTLTSYPLTIEKETPDMGNLIGDAMKINKDKCEENKICSYDDINNDITLKLSSYVKTNNLKKFKESLDNNIGNINDYVTEIKYRYNTSLQIYSDKDSILKVNPESLLSSSVEQTNMLAPSKTLFKEIIDNKNVQNSKYEILSGRLPSNYDELILVVDKNYQIGASILYSLDLLDSEEYKDILKEIKQGKEVKIDSKNFSYDEFLNRTFKVVLTSDFYQKENGIWINKSTDEEYMRDKIKNGLTIKIVGIVKEELDPTDYQFSYIGYTNKLVNKVIEDNNNSDVIKEQLSNKNINVFTNSEFDDVIFSYDNNLKLLSYSTFDNPDEIELYPKNFEAKEEVENIIKKYNKKNPDDKIVYTDMVGILLKSVTSIVNVISYILIAFVSVSLVVSSIMISIITYISVLERTKEIGILRAIGASKKDVSRVFNAETIIEGFISGLLGIGITYGLCFIISGIVYKTLNVHNIAHLEILHAIILIGISVILNLISGFIPAKMASKKDPVVSLRTE